MKQQPPKSSRYVSGDYYEDDKLSGTITEEDTEDFTGMIFA
jgi:hypothetical protein